MFQRLSAYLFLVLAITLSGCSDLKEAVVGEDQPEDVNNRTVDVEFDNAELIALGVLQSSLLMHKYSRLYDYLSANDLSADAARQQDLFDEVPCFGTDFENTYSINGVEVAQPAPGHVEVVVSRKESRNAYRFIEDAEGNVLKRIPIDDSDDGDRPSEGEPYKEGDKVSLVFNGCVNEDGIVHNGELELEYTELRGLNDRFIEIDTPTCVANLIEQESLDEIYITVTGETLRFEGQEDFVALVIDGVESGITIDKSERKAVVLLADGVTSLGGDIVYAVYEENDGIVTPTQRCQGFERSFDAKFTNMSSLKDEVTYSLNGRAQLVNTTTDLNQYKNTIQGDRLEVTITQGNAIETFDVTDFEFRRTTSLDSDAANNFLSGDIYSRAIQGRVLVENTFVQENGIQEDYATAGFITARGRGFELIQIAIFELRVQLNVDFDGDSNGDLLSDFDGDPIETTWEDLLARNFQFAILQ